MDGTSVVRRDKILDAIILWGRRSSHVEALIQTGSLARRDDLADNLSDLDIEIIATDPTVLANNDGWIREIGDVITVLHLGEGQKWATRLTIFDGGVKADFTLAGVARLDGMKASGVLDPLYERGYRVLMDKSGIADGLPVPTSAFPVRALPSPQRFHERVEEFWFEAFHVPRYLARGELFLVKQRDWTMKELLLEMIEWHAIAGNPKPVDTWHLGARMQAWTDPETWRQLQGTFGRFDAEDSKRAFRETTRLYSRLARDVAKHAAFEYPHRVEEKILALG